MFPKLLLYISHFSLKYMILGTSLGIKDNQFNIIIWCIIKRNNKTNYYCFPFNKWCTLFNYLKVKFLRKIWKYNLTTKDFKLQCSVWLNFIILTVDSKWRDREQVVSFLNLLYIVGMYSSLFLINKDPNCKYVNMYFVLLTVDYEILGSSWCIL